MWASYVYVCIYNVIVYRNYKAAGDREKGDLHIGVENKTVWVLLYNSCGQTD